MNYEEKLNQIYHELATGKESIRFDCHYNNVDVKIYYADYYREIYYLELSYGATFSCFLDKIGGFLENINQYPEIWDQLLKDNSLSDFYSVLSKKILLSKKEDYIVENKRELEDKMDEIVGFYQGQYLKDVSNYYDPRVKITYQDKTAPEQVYDYLQRYGIITEYTLPALNDDVDTEKRMKKIYEYLNNRDIDWQEGPAWNNNTNNFGEGAIYSIFDLNMMNHELAGKIVEGIKRYQSQVRDY